MNHIYQNLSYLMKAPFTKLDEELVQNTHVYLREQAEPFDVFSQFENPIGVKIVLLLGKTFSISRKRARPKAEKSLWIYIALRPICQHIFALSLSLWTLAKSAKCTFWSSWFVLHYGLRPCSAWWIPKRIIRGLSCTSSHFRRIAPWNFGINLTHGCLLFWALWRRSFEEDHFKSAHFSFMLGHGYRLGVLHVHFFHQNFEWSFELSCGTYVLFFTASFCFILCLAYNQWNGRHQIQLCPHLEAIATDQWRFLCSIFLCC